MRETLEVSCSLQSHLASAGARPRPADQKATESNVVPGPDHSPPTSVGLAPTPAAERIQILDILRGFAVFGILLVNLNGFTYHRSYEGAQGYEWWLKVVNRGAEQLVVQAGQGKFITLFSFLFGLSFALQLARAERRGAPVLRLYSRRLLVLLGIGLFHAFFLWEGDILVYYALVGFLLLLFRNCRPKTLLIWAAILYALPLASWEVSLGRRVRNSSASKVAPSVLPGARRQNESNQKETEREVFGRGSLAEIQAQRTRNVLAFYARGLQEVPRRLALFLFGLYLGKRRIFENLRTHLSFFRRLWALGLSVGITGNFALFVLYLPALPAWTKLLRPIVTIMSILGLASFYVAALVLLFQRETAKRWLSPLAETGRLALTNYLLQSVFFVAIFYGYGLGLYERIEPATGLCLTVLIYGVEVVLSVWWLRRFRFGPIEWVWRVATYGKFQPIRL